jgi:hypothetical protein
MGPSAPANPTGNPNFNLKNRPEVKKSGPENRSGIAGPIAGMDANAKFWRSIQIFVKIERGRCCKKSINGGSINELFDQWGVDQLIVRPMGGRLIDVRSIGGRSIVGRSLKVEPYEDTLTS